MILFSRFMLHYLGEDICIAMKLSGMVGGKCGYFMLAGILMSKISSPMPAHPFSFS